MYNLLPEARFGQFISNIYISIPQKQRVKNVFPIVGIEEIIFFF